MVVLCMYIENYIESQYRELVSFAEINYEYIEFYKALHEHNKSSFDLKLIGEGSYAHVYKYKDTFYDHPFVLKRAKKTLLIKNLPVLNENSRS